MSSAASIAILLAVLVAASDAVPYSKYGRSCKDIGCRSNEVCVMAEDPCSRYQSDNACGRYPTCQRSSDGGESCTTKLCPTGQYCKTENGRPTCVNTTPGLAPAARRPPGYQRPKVTPRPVIPTPPPRSSSFGNRYGGSSNYGGGGTFGGGSNSGGSGYRSKIGQGSVWDRLYGGGGGAGSRGGIRDYQRPTTSRPAASNYYPGGKDHYQTHTATDSKGNRVWTFSG